MGDRHVRNLLFPGDPGFREAARPWTAGVRQPVIAVATAEDVADVVSLVRYARNAGFTISAQPSGHGASGDVAGVILLRTGRLDHVEVDPVRRVARVGAGTPWSRVLAEAARHGLTGLGGSSPAVSVAGYLTGGGLSWFGRKHGWAADSVRAFEVVDADGRRARVTADSDAELFWALRGGGGDFALITSIELDLFPVPRLYGGRTVWPGSRAVAAFEAFHRVTATAPGDLSVWINRTPAAVTVDVTYLGGEDEARDLLAPFDALGPSLADSRALMDAAGLGRITAVLGPQPSRAELLTGLDDTVLKVLATAPPNFQVRHLGGALAAANPAGGAGGALAEPYLLHLQASSAAEIGGALAAHVSGRKPYTFLAPGETAAQAFPPHTLTRLREIKNARDPFRVFRANFPVHE